jgi:hypothetical protein
MSFSSHGVTSHVNEDASQIAIFVVVCGNLSVCGEELNNLAYGSIVAAFKAEGEVAIPANGELHAAACDSFDVGDGVHVVLLFYKLFNVKKV